MNINPNKIKVALLYGGRSTEHEVSLLSALNIYSQLDRDRFDPIMVAIDKHGQWFFQADEMKVKHPNEPKNIELTQLDEPILVSQHSDAHVLISQKTMKTIAKIDVLFPVLHGSFGEDGALQGLARLMNIACVGPGILGSAVGMDKELMKRILTEAGIPNANFITVRKSGKDKISYQVASEKLGTEMFVKPANLGSSVGITFVKKEEDFQKAVEYALSFDHKVIIEERIIGRELECAILGNEEQKASVPGEVIPKGGFYSYENKYIDEHGAALEMPAQLETEQVTRIQELSIHVCTLLECHGMTRVDMFMKEDGSLFINEVNTLPGFTKISMYPKLWELSGVPTKNLISRLIDLAIEQQTVQNSLTVSII